MSDETPRDRFRETPAPDGPPPPGQPRRYETNAPRLRRGEPSDGAIGKGILAALGLAATFVMVEAVAMVMVMAYSAGGDEAFTLATWVGLLVVALGAGAAVVVSRRLPRAARASFWAMGTVCVACALIFLVGVCGMEMPRIGG